MFCSVLLYPCSSSAMGTAMCSCKGTLKPVYHCKRLFSQTTLSHFLATSTALLASSYTYSLFVGCELCAFCSVSTVALLWHRGYEWKFKSWRCWVNSSSSSQYQRTPFGAKRRLALPKLMFFWKKGGGVISDPYILVLNFREYV